jgi:2-oxoglutarate ferredoxin oxidoreductase subunit delta
MESVKDKKELKVVIETGWCKGCGICVELCPKAALAMNNKEKAVWQYPDRCVRCGLCELRCPDLAISLQGEEKEGDGE